MHTHVSIHPNDMYQVDFKRRGRPSKKNVELVVQLQDEVKDFADQNNRCPTLGAVKDRVQYLAQLKMVADQHGIDILGDQALGGIMRALMCGCVQARLSHTLLHTHTHTHTHTTTLHTHHTIIIIVFVDLELINIY